MESSSQTFVAPVVYVQPKFEELKRRFPVYVDQDYKGKCFKSIERCRNVLKENREIAFEYVCMDRDASTDEVLVEMDHRGLRPALYEELLGFSEKCPDEQQKYPIIALGSEVIVDGHSCVACLWDDGGGRCLHLYWIYYNWCGFYRFLAVRKEAN